ncbi:MAG: MobF family relaxase [Cyanobacteria bacterium P01_D01_bin.105]
MLSTSNLSAAQAENYFVKDDYYTEEEQHEASFWLGKGAANLSLTGTVEKAVFGELLSGTGPNGETLSGKGIDPKTRRAATDFTFSAPKSVSIAALVQDDDRVLAAHHQAVAKALTVLEERYAQTRISTEMGRQRLTTGNLVAAVFPHATNREAEPQLHSHCVVMNATQLPDGRWFSFANEQAISNKKLLGQIYQNELAIALKKQGYAIDPKAHGQFELKDYSPDLLKLFSTRRQQIEALVALWEAEGKGVFNKDGQMVRSRLAVYEAAALKSRKQKPKPMQPEQLRQGWNALVKVEGMSLPEPPNPASQTLEVEKLADITSAIQHCGERQSVFRRTQLERFVFEHHLGKQRFEQWQQSIEENPELVRIDDHRMTTQAAIQLELETIRLMQAGQGQSEAITSPQEIEPSLEKKSLTDEQQHAIALTLTTSDSVIAWQGSAGVGKTYALRELKAILDSKEFQVQGFAPSAEAAHVLGASLKIETGTVAGLLVSEPLRPSENKIWIIDEAGLLSMKDAHALLRRAKNANARVLLVGDTKQLSSVEAGNPFKSLQAGGIALAQLDHSQRQKTQELQLAVNLISEGHVARGINVLEQADCLHIAPELEQQTNQMVDDYMRLIPGARAETLLLVGTKREQRALTQKMRRALQAKGHLGENALTVKSLQRKDLTSVQAQYASAYQPGDVLIPSQTYKKQSLEKFQQYVVRQIDKEAQSLVVETAAGQLMSLDPACCKRKTVYRVQSVEVAKGDRLRWTRNDRATNRRNGSQFTVADIDAAGNAQLMDDQGKVTQTNLQGYQFIDHALVSTIYSSQGKTANRVLALMNSTINQESFYVAVSRAKHRLSIYTTDIADLTQQAQRSRAKENASDYIPLFQVVTHHAKAQKENSFNHNPASDGRDVGKSLGDRLAQNLTATLWRDSSTQTREHETATASQRIHDSTSRQSRLIEQLEQAGDDLARSANPTQSNPHQIIRTFRQQRDWRQLGLLTTLFRNLGAGIDRLEQQVRQQQQLSTRISQHLSQLKSVFRPDQPNRRQHYQELWEHYSQSIQSNNLDVLDRAVAAQALSDGQSPKEVGLMLIASSPNVQRIYQSDGKRKAMLYIQQTLNSLSQKQSRRSVIRKTQQLEM